MSCLKAIKGLLIDIDDTITRFKPGCPPVEFGGLMQVLERAGVELAGLTPEESVRIVQRVRDEIIWWHWSDFIVELELNPKRFWEFAYQIESAYLESTGEEILPALQSLHDKGFLLYVASNNPSDGILHKLRLAGIAHVNGTTLFHQLLGVAQLQAMKGEPRYWQKALAHIALDAHEVAVVGDNLHDDYEIPHSVGIGLSFLINREEDRSARNTESLIHVRSFLEIVDTLCGEDLP